MKKLLTASLLMVLATTSTMAQNGTTKFCPGTPAWKANAFVNDANFMYTEYAKGPGGCWWMKSASFASYAKGTYTFSENGVKTNYTYDTKSKTWSNGKACVKNPFTGRW